MRSSKIKYDFTFELSQAAKPEPFFDRCIDSIILKPVDNPKFTGFFYSFLVLPLMRGFLVLLSSVARINRQNVIPFLCGLSFQGKNWSAFGWTGNGSNRIDYPSIK